MGWISQIFDCYLILRSNISYSLHIYIFASKKFLAFLLLCHITICILICFYDTIIRCNENAIRTVDNTWFFNLHQHAYFVGQSSSPWLFTFHPWPNPKTDDGRDPTEATQAYAYDFTTSSPRLSIIESAIECNIERCLINYKTQVAYIATEEYAYFERCRALANMERCMRLGTPSFCAERDKRFRFVESKRLASHALFKCDSDRRGECFSYLRYLISKNQEAY